MEEALGIFIRIIMLTSFGLAVGMLVYHFKSSFEFKSSPGIFVLQHNLFSRKSELTEAGVIYKKKFWFYWRLWLFSVFLLGLVKLVQYNVS